MASLALVWDLIANDGASPVFTRVGAAAERAAAQTDAATASIERSSLAMARVAKVATAAGAVFAAVSIKMAADFQQSVTKLATTAGESTANLKMVGDGMLAMAGKVGISAETLAQGMYTVESAGYHGADALTVMKAAAEGARQENADLGKVTDAVTTILHDYHLPASQAADVTSQLVTAVSHGKVSFDELTGAMHSITPLAAAAHIPLADIAGTLSAMTASGESADQATDNMRNALQHLITPLPSQVAELAALGITATDLSDRLSQRGLAGTLQDVSQAILTKMGPSGKVLLDAFNQSKQAGQAMSAMIGAMPDSLAKLSRGLLDGSVSIIDYRKTVNGLGGQAGAAGLQFLSLYKSADGFNSALRSGGPQAQSYESALQKATGTVAGMTVALMTTGENAVATNAAIQDIAHSAAQADGNIKGWDEVQGNFNQKLAEFGASVGALAIKFGQHLLPALTSAFGYLTDHVVPGVQQFGAAIAAATQSGGFQSFLSGASLALHALWDVLKGVASTVGPAIEGVGHLFGSLPGPIQAATIAVAAFALAVKTGLLSGLPAAGAAVQAAMVRVGAAVAAPAVAIKGFNDDMALQQRLMQMEAESASVAAAGLARLTEATTALAAAETEEQRIKAASAISSANRLASIEALVAGNNAEAASLTRAQMALIGYDAALAATIAEEEAAVVATGGLSGALSIMAQRGIGAAVAGVRGLMGMLGGPMGLALIGVTVGVMAFEAAVQRADEKEKSWTEALKEGGKAAKQATLDMAAATAQVNEMTNSWASGIATGNGFLGMLSMFAPGVAGTASAVRATIPSAQDAKKAYDDWYNSLNGVDRAQQDVKIATAALIAAQDAYGPSSLQANEAATVLAGAQDRLKTKTDDATNAARSHVQALQDEANAAMASVSSSLAAQQANVGFTLQLKSYEDQLKAGTLSGDAQTQALLGLTQAAISAAQAAGQAAVDQAKANGITDDGTIANKAILQSLQDTAAQYVANGLQVPAEIQKQIDALNKATNTTDVLKAHVEDLGLKTRELPDHTVTIDVPTIEQLKRLHELGDTVVRLPNGNIVVYANTDPALKALGDLIHSYDHYTINLDAQVPGGHLVVGKSAFANAEGALLSHLGNGQMAQMFASGGLNPMSASSAAVVGANTWRVIGDRPHGDEAFIPIDHSARSQEILSLTAARMGYGLAKFAAGGFFDSGHHINGTVYANTAHAAAGLTDLIGQIRGQLNQQLATTFAVGSAGGAARWSALVLQALSMEGQPASLLATVLRRMNQESGGNPRAINLTDINAKLGTPSKGLMQTIDPTFRAYHFPGTSWDVYDPLANILASMNYAIRRYGSLPAAYNRAGGYDDGGWLPSGGTGMNSSGKPEPVFSASQWEVLKGNLGGSGDATFHLYDSDGALMGTMRGQAQQVTTSAMGTATTRTNYSAARR